MNKWSAFTDEELIAFIVKDKNTEAFGYIYERYKKYGL